MNQLLSLLLLLVATSWGVSAAIGPRADLKIVNANMAPDGFNRSFVYRSSCWANVFTGNHSTVLAGGTFPGPLIQGNKVGEISKRGYCTD
jgi:iron transport multicopper oxidase